MGSVCSALLRVSGTRTSNFRVMHRVECVEMAARKNALLQGIYEVKCIRWLNSMLVISSRRLCLFIEM